LNGDFTKILLQSLADKLQTFQLNNMDEIMFHDMQHIRKHFNADKVSLAGFITVEQCSGHIIRTK